MTDASHVELLASYEEALEAARRSLKIARELAEAHRSGHRPHDAALTTYLASIERDEDTLQGLRAKVAQFKGLFKTH
jgi:hypothetical protein